MCARYPGIDEYHRKMGARRLRCWALGLLEAAMRGLVEPLHAETMLKLESEAYLRFLSESPRDYSRFEFRDHFKKMRCGVCGRLGHSAIRSKSKRGPTTWVCGQTRRVRGALTDQAWQADWRKPKKPKKPKTQSEQFISDFMRYHWHGGAKPRYRRDLPAD